VLRIEGGESSLTGLNNQRTRMDGGLLRQHVGRKNPSEHHCERLRWGDGHKKSRTEVRLLIKR
jgi:hypothetical protein